MRLPLKLILLVALLCSALLPDSILARSATRPQTIKVVFLGDSLTDGYGIPRDRAYPALIEQRLKAAGHTEIEVINAGVSGSTTASGESRLKWHLKANPHILVLALGANDGLRGMKLEETKNNLTRMVQTAQERKIDVLLVGMKMPPNYGLDYTQKFEKIFPELAKSKRVPLVPFLLEGIGGEKDLNLPDGIHPNEKGHVRMAEIVYPHLLKLVKERK